MTGRPNNLQRVIRGTAPPAAWPAVANRVLPTQTAKIPARPPAPTPTPAPTLTPSAADTVEAPSNRLLTPTRIGFLVLAAAIWFGLKFPTERYITPERGLGYALGIVGGSVMLLLLLYPARKRLPWLGPIGSVKVWFQSHIVLGLVGPLLVLYHSNFSLGAPNSNAALIAMLLVAGSGVFGRYFYTRVHRGLDGRRSNRHDLQNAAEDMRHKVAGSKFVPDLLTMLDEADKRLLAWTPGESWLLLRPLFVSWRMTRERWRITHRALAELRAAATTSRVLKQQHKHFATAVKRYIAKRLQATREVAEFESYERLFSLWHLLHLPMYYLLLIAGIVHVVAVHVY